MQWEWKMGETGDRRKTREGKEEEGKSKRRALE